MLAILLLATGCSDSYCPSLDKVVTVEESDFYEISLSGLKPREIDLDLMGDYRSPLLRLFVGCHDFGDGPVASLVRSPLSGAQRRLFHQGTRTERIVISIIRKFSEPG